MKCKGTALILIILAASGCASRQYGNEDFVCPGYETGIPCRDVRTVYSLTDGSDWRQRIKAPAHAEAQDHADDPPQVIYQYDGPLVQRAQGPRPILEQSVPMRVWIAPWEDEAGNLVWTGHVYTELKPARWSIGEGSVEASRVATPLVVKP